MTRRPSDIPLEKVTVNLFRGDLARLREMHPELPPSEVLRIILRKHLTELEVHTPTKKVDLTQLELFGGKTDG